MTIPKERIDLIRKTVAQGVSETALKLLLDQAERTDLDPLARQIYVTERSDYTGARKPSVECTIDGFRLVAERHGKYAGQSGPFWCGDDGVWMDVWVSSEPPAAARVGVLRHDFTEPCWGTARFSAYAQQKKGGGLNRAWGNMGDVMIAKCAEALALRKAFPKELSGLYTSDEMAQATPVEQGAPHITKEKNKYKGLNGPHETMMALQNAIKAVVHDIEGAGDIIELAGVLTDNVATIDQCETDKPAWYDGRADFIGLGERIEKAWKGFDGTDTGLQDALNAGRSEGDKDDILTGPHKTMRALLSATDNIMKKFEAAKNIDELRRLLLDNIDTIDQCNHQATKRFYGDGVHEGAWPLMKRVWSQHGSSIDDFLEAHGAALKTVKVAPSGTPFPGDLPITAGG